MSSRASDRGRRTFGPSTESPGQAPSHSSASRKRFSPLSQRNRPPTESAFLTASRSGRVSRTPRLEIAARSLPVAGRNVLPKRSSETSTFSSPSSRTASSRKRRRLRRGSRSVHESSGLTIANGSPGLPPPDPMSRARPPRGSHIEAARGSAKYRRILSRFVLNPIRSSLADQ